MTHTLFIGLSVLSIYLEIFPLQSLWLYGNCLGMEGQKRLQTLFLVLEDQYKYTLKKSGGKIIVWERSKNRKEQKKKQSRWFLTCGEVRTHSVFTFQPICPVVLVEWGSFCWSYLSKRDLGGAAGTSWPGVSTSGAFHCFSTISGGYPAGLKLSDLLAKENMIWGMLHYAVLLQMAYDIHHGLMGFSHLMPIWSRKYLNIMTDNWQGIKVV